MAFTGPLSSLIFGLCFRLLRHYFPLFGCQVLNICVPLRSFFILRSIINPPDCIDSESSAALRSLLGQAALLPLIHDFDSADREKERDMIDRHNYSSARSL